MEHGSSVASSPCSRFAMRGRPIISGTAHTSKPPSSTNSPSITDSPSIRRPRTVSPRAVTLTGPAGGSPGCSRRCAQSPRNSGSIRSTSGRSHPIPQACRGRRDRGRRCRQTRPQTWSRKTSPTQRFPTSRRVRVHTMLREIHIVSPWTVQRQDTICISSAGQPSQQRA